MVLGLFEIDKSGYDALTKNYSVVVVLNREHVYGFRVDQFIQDALKNDFNKKRLGLNSRLRFKLRFHTSTVILLIRETLKKNKNLTSFKIEICNDYDKHFHEIKDMIFKNLCFDALLLKKEDIMMARFDKNSLVNQAAHAFYKNDKNRLEGYNVCRFKLEDLKELIKKSGNQGQ